MRYPEEGAHEGSKKEREKSEGIFHSEPCGKPPGYVKPDIIYVYYNIASICNIFTKKQGERNKTK